MLIIRLAAQPPRRWCPLSSNVRPHKMNDVITPIQHLRSLQALLEELALQGIVLLIHEYSSASFGNFVLVFGARHQKARFSWDGKEQILTAEYQKVQNESVEGAWEHDAYVSVSPTEGVFAEIGSNAVAMLE
jgi:hypothetical protein